MINLPGYLQRNGYKVPQDVKTGPFADTWGKNTWALYKAEPWRGDIFNSFMTKWKEGTTIWTDRYPVQRNLCTNIDQTRNAVLLVDIGGGNGQMLKEFAQNPANKTGRLILQDLPEVLRFTESLKDQGIEPMPYDFFTPQPIKGKYVL